MSALLRCDACGGAIVWQASRSGAACLYCDTVALRLDPDAEIPAPELYLAPTVAPAQAEARFRAWAGSSWFRPAALREARVELALMLIPAWRFDAELETHWAGLRPAATRSGRRPASGVDRTALSHSVVASSGLSQAELAALLPFDEDASADWHARQGAEAQVAWEPPALTRRGARSEAHLGMLARHRRQIARSHGLVRVRATPLIEDRDVRLLMLPIYIGSFRHDDRPWRLVINAQTGKVVGDAPVDWRKVAAVVLGLALAAALLIALVLGRSGAHLW